MDHGPTDEGNGKEGQNRRSGIKSSTKRVDTVTGRVPHGVILRLLSSQPPISVSRPN